MAMTCHVHIIVYSVSIVKYYRDQVLDHAHYVPGESDLSGRQAVTARREATTMDELPSHTGSQLIQLTQGQRITSHKGRY